jgi:putative transposase
MPRKPRFFVADLPTHVVERGNNRQAIFFADNDYRVYLSWIIEAAQHWNCAEYSYVLMNVTGSSLLTSFPKSEDLPTFRNSPCSTWFGDVSAIHG